MSQPISLRAKLFLIAFGIALPLIVLEIGLKVLGSAQGTTEFENISELRTSMLQEGNAEDSQGNGVSLKTIIYPHENDGIIYDLKPNLDVRFQRANVKTNSCGMRGPERPVAKPDNTYRIALLGDSFTFGWGVEQKETFAQVIEDNLNAIYKGSPAIEVLNFGVPGYSTFQEVHQFIEKGDAFNPDAVLVFFVQNDFGPPFFIRNLGKPGIVPSTEIAQLAMKLLDPRAAERAIRDAGLDPNHSLNLLAEHCSKKGIPLLLTINPKKDWRQYHRQLWILKKRKDIQFLRLREDFELLVNNRTLTNEDLNLSFDPHPSPLRHELYGDIITPHLMRFIRHQ